jgi:tRNA threonylcarbamoyl adenosine modification protein YeaZ
MKAETHNRGPLMLALDTSGDVCGVAVLRAGTLVAEHTFRHGMHLSEHLIAHLDAVLKEAGAQLAQVVAFAVGTGPGSFTGTRIGVMTAKTLAAVRERPLYGIGGLEALALEYAGIREPVVVVLPCRADTVFAAVYDVAAGWPAERSAPAVRTFAALAGEIADDVTHSVLCCGEGGQRHRTEVERTLGSEARLGWGLARFPRAGMVGALAWRRLIGGDPGEDPAAVVPLYLAPPPITLPKTPHPLPAEATGS